MERQNKAQRRWHSSLSILSPFSLPSLFLFETEKLNWKNLKRRRVRKRAEETGRKEEYDELKRREDTRNKETDGTLLSLSSLPSLSLAFPSISFLVFLFHSIRKRSFLWCDFEIQKRTREEKGERKERGEIKRKQFSWEEQ